MSNKVVDSPTKPEKDADGNKSLNNTINSVDMLFSQSQSMLKSPGALQNLSDLIFQQMRLDQVGELKGNAPTIPINDLKGPEAGSYSRQEKVLRCSLASLYRLVDLNGWTQSIYNHISLKSSTNPENYLINPFGLLYHEIQASSLILINTEGNIIDPGSSVLGINKTGWTLHSAIHNARKDINCVVHVHMPDVIAVSCIKSGLLPVSPEAQELINSCGIKYHYYKGILVNEKEQQLIKEDLGDNAKILFLRNHGVAIAATSVPEAWYILRRVINACQTQMRLLQLGMGKTILNQIQAHQSSDSNGIKKSLSLNGGQQRPFESLLSSNGHDANGEAAIKTSDNETTRIDEKIDNEIWTVEEQEFEAEMRVLDSAGYKTGHTYKKPNLLRRNPMNNTMFLGDTMMTGNNYDTMADTSAFMSDSIGDDVMTASQAGKNQMNKIAENVRSHREKSLSRRQDHPGINEVSTPKNDKITPKDLVNQKSMLNSSKNSSHTNGKSSEKTVTLPHSNDMKNDSNSQSLTPAEMKKKSTSFRKMFKITS